MGVPKHQRNTIKTNQVWAKKDTGVMVEIVAKSKGVYYTTRRIDSRGGKNSKKRSHHISMYDLLKHWNRIT